MKTRILWASAFAAIAVGLGSCVDDSPYQGPANITNIQYTPTTVTSQDDVNVSAVITSFQNVEASIIYNVDNGNDIGVSMTQNGQIFVGTIPAQSDGATVTFAIAVLTGAGFQSQSAPVSYTVGATPVDYSTLTINELNGDTKFIELFNSGTEPVNLAGCYIVKDEGSTVWTAPDTTITSQGFMLLFSVDVESSHAGFPASLLFNSGLSNKKTVSFGLFTPQGAPIDTFERGVSPWGGSISNTGTDSYARCPDGVDNWQMASPTPGTANPTTGTESVPQT